MTEYEAMKPEDYLNLVKLKEKIELEINVLLKSMPIHMSEPLVDPEGFPRSDIDIASIRQTRRRVNELQTDHCDVMKKIETTLNLIHQTNTEMAISKQLSDVVFVPIAIVNAVAPHSPAFEAGIMVQDKIFQFGHLNSQNMSQFTEIATIMQQLRGQEIELIIERLEAQSLEKKRLTLHLTPKEWSGNGLIGCHLIPYK